MSGTQQLVGIGAIGLIAANLWTGKQRETLAPLWTGNGDLAGAHRVAKQVGVELIGATVLVVAAGTGDSAAHAGLAIVVSLWLVWFMTRPGTGQLPNGQWQQFGPYNPNGSGLQPGR